MKSINVMSSMNKRNSIIDVDNFDSNPDKDKENSYKNTNTKNMDSQNDKYKDKDQEKGRLSLLRNKK